VNERFIDPPSENHASGSEDVATPPLTVSAPDRSRVTIALDPAAHTVGDVATALGVPKRAAVLIDGRPVERRTRLDRSGIGQGSRLTARQDRCRGLGHAPSTAPTSGHAVGPPRTVVTVEAGPAAGRVFELGAGRHVVGRANGATVRLADDLVELHHAVVNVAADPAPAVPATFVQLAGRVPCRASLAPAQPDVPIDGELPLPSRAVVIAGASRLRVEAARGADGATSGGRVALGGPPPAALAPMPTNPWRSTLHRTPRSLRSWNPVPIEVPAADAARSRQLSGGMLAAVMSVLAGGVMAVVLGHAMFLMFSALGFLVAVGTRISGRLSDRKARRQNAVESRRERERFASEARAQQDARLAYHMATAPKISDALTTACRHGGDLWIRRGDHPDAFAVSLGWGTVSWTLSVAGSVGAGRLSEEMEAEIAKAEQLVDVPVVTDLGPGRSIALVGHRADAVARSLLVQLAALTGPADWRLVVVADEPADWDWCGWLPHASAGLNSGAAPMVVAGGDVERLTDVLGRLDDGDDRHVVVLTDRPDLLATRTGPLRRFLGTAESAGVVAVVRPGAVVPSMCRSVLEIGSLCTARWCADTSTATETSALHAAGVSASDADDAARMLARVHDPEDPSESAGSIPATVGLSQLMRRSGLGTVDDPISIAALWRSGRNHDSDELTGDGRPRAAIGLTADGVVEVDLVRDGPHALIAGTTGAGKSELLRTLVVALAARCSPDDLTFVLIDYKGGSTFDACDELPHTVGVVTDLDDRLAERALVSLEAEIRRRERLLRGASVDDLDSFRALRSADPLPRLVVVIDEFAAMAAELPDFLSSLVGVAQRGRSLGIHLVLATQRPTGVVSDEIRANTNLRIALRLQDRADATDIVGDGAPTRFPRGAPGRAMMRLGPGETLVFQTAHSSGLHQPVGGGGLRVLQTESTDSQRGRQGAAEEPDPRDATELEVLTRSIRSAASLCEIAPPFRPWLEPLPETLSPADLAAYPPGTVGIVDEPANQRRSALRWTPPDGNLALVGSLGSGTTTALLSAVGAGAGSALIYAISANGDGRLDELAALPNCGGVIGLHDAERRGRLVRLLDGELEQRRASPAADRPPLIFAIDGLAALLGALNSPGEMDEHARLVRVLTDGVAAGIHAIATFERPGGLSASVLAAFAQRWLFHLDDPLDGAVVGVKSALVPAAVPGRMVIAGSRLEAHVAVLPLPAVEAGTGATTAPEIGTLSSDIDADTLPATTGERGSAQLVVGVDFATLGPAALDVPDGEHVLIAGPARSGRSTALVRTIAAWRQAHPGGTVVTCCPRPGSPLATWADRVAGAVNAADENAIVGAVGEAVAVGRVVVAVDDAERLADEKGDLLALVSERHPNVTVVAAGRPDSLRTMYGHWTAVVRRSRIGLVLSAGSETDGDLFGEQLPRRIPLRPRVGLTWLFDGAGRRLVQVARDLQRESSTRPEMTQSR
jgi:S-DNA-T family DNA segregation ATPase FtsK/SpoIIIE